jgi:hypothetical protein
MATDSALCTSSGNFCGAAHHVTATTIAGASSVFSAPRAMAEAGSPRAAVVGASSSAVEHRQRASSQTVPGTLPNCSTASVSARRRRTRPAG